MFFKKKPYTDLNKVLLHLLLQKTGSFISLLVELCEMNRLNKCCIKTGSFRSFKT